MNNKVAKIIATAAITTIAGLTFVDSNVKADTTTEPTDQQLVTQPTTQTATASSLNLYSNNLTQVQNTQNINFPSGYTLDAVRNINNETAANAFQQQVAQQGIYNNDYQSDPEAAQQKVDINNLTADQVEDMNRYGLSLVNKARSEFGEEPFTQDDATINQVKNMAIQYQDKGESLLKGNWHDFDILQGKSENIATYQVYADNVNGLTARPFASAKGSDFANSHSVPLFSLTTMDDLHALVYYGIMGMLFNDADDNFGHAQNFLTYNQPITTMALYPSLTYSSGQGHWGNGEAFTFRLENVDMHYIWVTGDDYNTADLSNSGSVAKPWDTSDNGNYAYLDGAYISNDGQLVATGWHATNASLGHPYHYLIALDQNGRELGRVRIDSPVARPDVQKAHNVYNAAQSGFSTKIDLGTGLATATSVRLISRYSASEDGNSNYVDYYFAPITVDRNNYANLDGAVVDGGELQLSGWHATNQAAGKKYHYIIILNNGKEVDRALVKDGINRADVANVYPSVDGSGKSGFTVKFAVNKLNFNQRIQVLSRYTDDPAGNGNAVDYWFAPLTEGTYSNQASLDNFKIANGKLNISGWHANGVSQFERNHFIILYDATDNRQVASFAAPTVARPDVQRVYPTVTNAGQSGFDLSIDLSKLALVPGHRYAVISRYSSSSVGNGNGNGSQYTDYWFDAQPLASGNEAGHLDNWSITRQADGQYQMKAAGWRATNMPQGYHTLILVDNTTNQEVTRQTISATPAGSDRPDVARIYASQYLNAGQSGFATQFAVPNLQVGDDYTLYDRYSLTQDANEDYVDVPFHIGVITAADIKNK